MNKALIISVIILIIIFAGYFILKGKSGMYNGEKVDLHQEEKTKLHENKTESNENKNVPVSQEENKKENIVVYTDSGFSPNKLEVSLGSTVVFKNESSVLMWVASSPHPIHTDYPEFDARKGYAKGVNYSFTFGRVGEFKYHNHLNPSKFGSIVVK